MKHHRGAAVSAGLKLLSGNKRAARIIGSLLILAACILFVVMWGWMSGICAALVGLMGVGCLAVAIYPMRILKISGLVLMILFFLILEILI